MSDITYEYIRNYLKAITPDDDDILEIIRKESLANNIPIIKPEVKKLLETLLLIHKPRKILEIGTAAGYSAIIMGRYLTDGSTITTIEKSNTMALKAKKNIEMARMENIIHVIEGEAEQILMTLDTSYDMIFVDAAKGQYLNFLPDCLRLLKIDGLFISDNVLQNGLIAKSRFSIPKRQRTIHRRMREYLWELSHNCGLQTVILPIADGFTISLKK